jgi:glycosyltransferase involved in cell wall biosynthesis
MKGTIEVSIVLPCLNEAETIAICIRKARQSLDEMKISGEIVIGDNGSTDGSQGIAESLGARLSIFSLMRQIVL